MDTLRILAKRCVIVTYLLPVFGEIKGYAPSGLINVALFVLRERTVAFTNESNTAATGRQMSLQAADRPTGRRTHCLAV